MHSVPKKHRKHRNYTVNTITFFKVGRHNFAHQIYISCQHVFPVFRNTTFFLSTLPLCSTAQGPTMVSFSIIGLAAALTILASHIVATPAPQFRPNSGCRLISKTSGPSPECRLPTAECGFGQYVGRTEGGSTNTAPGICKAWTNVCLDSLVANPRVLQALLYSIH